MGLFDPYSDMINNSKGDSIEKGIFGWIKGFYSDLVKNVRKPYGTIKNSELEPISEKGKAPISKKKIEKIQADKVTFGMVFLKLFALIRKDLNLILRSKTSALIIFFGPLLLILLVGLAFNSSTLYNLKVASYTPSETALTGSVIAELQDEQYTVTSVENENECKEYVRSGEYQVCVVFPEDFEAAGSGEDTITYFVDESRVNIASLIADTVNQKIRIQSRNISIGLTNDIIGVLDETRETIDSNLDNVNALVSANSDAALQLGNAKSTYESFDLEFDIENYNFSGVQEVITEVSEDNNNLSLNKISNALDDLEFEFLLLEDKLQAMQSDNKQAIDDLTSARTSISNTSSLLIGVRTALQDTKTGIDGITVTDAGVIVNPIKTSIEPLTQEQGRTHLGFLFPTLLVLVVMFISVLLSSTVVLKEKTSTAFFRNFINPTGDFLYLLGTYITNVLLVGLQIVIILLASIYFFGESLTTVIWPLALVLFIAASVFILLGMTIGYLFKTEETATLGSIALASILLFFSNTILPIESLPGLFREVVSFNPFVLAEQAVKQIILFSAGFTQIYWSLIYLGIFIIALFIAASIGRAITRKRG